MARPKTYDQALRDRILLETRNMLSEEGYPAVSLRTITSRAETSTNAVYSLFGSREELIAEAIEAEVSQASAVLTQIAQMTPPEAAFVCAAKTVRVMTQGAPKLFEASIQALADARRSAKNSPDEIRSVGSLFQGVIDPIQDLCQRIAISAGVTGAEPKRMATLFWCSAEGFFCSELSGAISGSPQERDRLYQDMLATLYAGWSGKQLGAFAEQSAVPQVTAS